MTAISWVVGVFKFFCRCIIGTLTNSSVLTTTEDLEDITIVHVDGCASPNLRLCTIAATKDIKRLTQHVHTLLVENDARVTLQDIVIIVTIQNGLTFVLFHLVEDGIRSLAVNNGCIDVDDHIAIHMTRIVTTAIDVTTFQAAVQVIIGAFSCRSGRGIEFHLFSRCRTDSVPYQSL